MRAATTAATTAAPRPGLVRLVHRVHRWTGLASALNLLVLALTGMLLVFHGEIDHALGTVPPPAAAPAGGATPAPLAAIVDAARRREPALAVRYVSADPEDPSRVFVTMQPAALRGEAGQRNFVFDAYTGAPLAAIPESGGLTGWLFRLHVELFAGNPGRVYVLLVGVTFLVSLATGVLVYAPFARRLGFGVVRAEPRAGARGGGSGTAAPWRPTCTGCWARRRSCGTWWSRPRA